jgi:rhodanese-related sulfurtransferase
MAARGGFIMKKIITLFNLFLFAGCLVILEASFALTPEELKEMLDQGEKVTIIDVRHKGLYTDGHIPGAINIPSSVIGMKRLPPIGEVVVYGDGIRVDLTMEAVNELNSKTGIHAEMLEGGIAAWESLNYSTTHPYGLGKKRFDYLTYDDFERALIHNPDIIVIDLREGVPLEEDQDGQGEAPVLTDMSERFPGVDIIKPRRNRGAGARKWDVSADEITRGRGPKHRNQYVIVDDGDGQGEKAARRLFAAGIKRVVILTGGEQTLSREGEKGFKKIQKKYDIK